MTTTQNRNTFRVRFTLRYTHYGNKKQDDPAAGDSTSKQEIGLYENPRKGAMA